MPKEEHSKKQVSESLQTLEEKLSQKDDELQELLTLQTKIIDSLTSGIFAYTLPERKIIAINKETKNILGFTNETLEEIQELIGDKLMVKNHQEISDIVKKLMQPGDTASYTFEVERDGRKHLIETTSRLMQLRKGKNFILSNLRDITEREKLSKLLHEERRLYRNALINNSEYFYLLDVTEGYVKDDIILRDGTGVVTELGFSIPVLYDELTHAAIKNNKIKLRTPGAEKYFTRQGIIDAYNNGVSSVAIEYYAVPFDTYTQIVMLFSKNEETGHIYAFDVATDITEERRKENEAANKLRQQEDRAKHALVEAYNAATRANKAKTEFLSKMSHDIRTPMNAIIGMTTIAEMHLDNKERVKDCLEKINISSKHLLGLINEVLDMSKIESGRIDLQVEEFDISKLMETLATINRTEIEARGHEFIVESGGIKHKNVLGDVQRIQQAFMNLITNSIKYTPNGGKIRIAAEERATNNPGIGCYEFTIEDNGIGMSEEYQQHIFEPFSRAEDDERVSKIQGTGLGMSITRNIIQMMNGNIKVKSKLNEGTKFTVTLFLETMENSANSEKKEFSVQNIKSSDYKGKRALLVEDNAINAEIATEILSMTGIQIETAQNGKVAVDKVSASADDYYDIIFMDVQMPLMNGYEAAKSIRALGKDYTNNIPIIAMTANAFSDDVIAAKNSGMNEHIAKPLNFELLMQTLKKWI